MAQQCAGALRCLEGAPHASAAAGAAELARKHLMVSYQWDVQEAVVRIVGSLKLRGFAVWFDMVRPRPPALVLKIPSKKTGSSPSQKVGT